MVSLFAVPPPAPSFCKHSSGFLQSAQKPSWLPCIQHSFSGASETAHLSAKAWVILKCWPWPRQSETANTIQAAYKGMGELTTTELKFSMKSYKTGIIGVGGSGGFPLFSSVQLEGFEEMCCSNKGLLLPFNLRHKDDKKFTPASYHVNEFKSTNRATQPLRSAIRAFNLCVEIPGTEKIQGHFSRTSPHKPLSHNKWVFFGGGGGVRGREKRSSNPC